jgi:peptidoglycan/LPS O-acetylase OafA/YrhL
MTKEDAAESLPPQLESGLKESQLAGLDGMRAIAAFMVVFYHFGIPFISGGAGVLIFFVLSGFLITWLLLRENEELGTVSLRKFYIRRSLRIFPAFYCYAALLLGVWIIRHTRIVWPQALSALFYVSNYYQALNGDPNTGFSHTWSLSIEEQFYVLWPLTFLLLRRNYRRMSLVLAGAILAIWVYREALIFLFNVDQGYIYEAFDTRADHLLIGCLLAVMLRARLLPRFWHWISVRSWAAVVIAALLAISSVLESFYGPPYRDSVSFIVNPVLTAIWITQLIALRRYFVALDELGVGALPGADLLLRVPVSATHCQRAREAACSAADYRAFGRIDRTDGMVASASHFLVERPFLRLKARFKQTTVEAAAK